MNDPDGFEVTGLAKLAGCVGEGLRRDVCDPIGNMIGEEIDRTVSGAVEGTAAEIGGCIMDTLRWLSGETAEDDYYNV